MLCKLTMKPAEYEYCILVCLLCSALQNQLVQTKDKYRQASGGVVERQRLLQDIQEEFERIKSEMDERGSTMTDGCSLFTIFVQKCFILIINKLICISSYILCFNLSTQNIHMYSINV